MTRRLPALLATLALAGGLAAAPQARANDAPLDGRAADTLVCSWQWRNLSGNSALTDTWRTPVNAGPYQECNTRRLLPYGRAVTLHCYSANKYGHFWWHVEVSGPTGSTMGWIYQDRLESHPPNWADIYGCKDGLGH